MPRVSSSRASPLMPTPPTPIRWTRAQVLGASSVLGQASVTAPAIGPPPRGRRCAAPRRRRGGRTRPRRRPSRPAARGSRTSGTTVRSSHSGVSSRVVDEQPTAGLHHGQRVAPLLAVAVRAAARRSAGSPTAATSAQCHRPAPAQHQVGGGVAQLHLGQVRQRHVRHRQVGAGSAPARCGRPITCSTWMPWRASSLAAPATARLIDRAPCEPPDDEQHRQVRVAARSGRGRRRGCAARSSAAMLRRSGTPTTRASAQRLGLRSAGAGSRPRRSW